MKKTSKKAADEQAALDIIADITAEKLRLEDTQRATLNILDDFNQEKERLQDTQRATLNILDDFNQEKERLSDTQRALLNILDDFELEKRNVERAKEELQRAHAILEVRVEERTAELRKSLRDKEVLIKEIYHRTKNNMHVITSLLGLQMNTIEDQAMVGKMRDLQNRIQAMALVHEKLYKTGDLSKLDLKDYITDLVDALVSGYLKGERQIAIDFDLESAVVSIDTAIPCGLIINELVSNCLKYAFPATPAAEKAAVIRLSLHALGETGFELLVADNGIGLPPGIDIKKASTLGLKIVYNLARQITGTVQVGPAAGGGTEFIIRFERD